MFGFFFFNFFCKSTLQNSCCVFFLELLLLLQWDIPGHVLVVWGTEAHDLKSQYLTILNPVASFPLPWCSPHWSTGNVSVFWTGYIFISERRRRCMSEIILRRASRRARLSSCPNGCNSLKQEDRKICCWPRFSHRGDRWRRANSRCSQIIGSRHDRLGGDMFTLSL